MVKCRGFTIVELITVLVIVGVLAGTVLPRLTPSASFQLQASRDKVVAAFFIAQQRAMSQSSRVRLITSANQVDMLVDTDDDGSFLDESSFNLDASAFPITLLPNQTLSSATFDFNRLGYTTSNNLTLSQDGGTVTIAVSATGFAN